MFNAGGLGDQTSPPERGTIAHLSALRKTGERGAGPPHVYPMRSEAKDMHKPPRKESSHFSAGRRSIRVHIS